MAARSTSGSCGAAAISAVPRFQAGSSVLYPLPLSSTSICARRCRSVRSVSSSRGPTRWADADWHAIDSGIGLASMEVGLAALEAEELLQRPASPALAALLFGALTDAGRRSRGTPASAARNC
jgi:hypothetical protein